jgi:adenosylcobinamide-GDP ribazoletransferase
MRDGLRLAVSLFTVAPVRADRVDRDTARVAMAMAPLVGLVLGAAVGTIGLGARWIGASSLVTGVLIVTLLAGLTRGLHLDGLADTADGLGSYGGPERALAIMKQSDIGPFGVITIVLALLAQAAAFAEVVRARELAGVLAVAAAVAVGRLAVTWACRPGVPAARPDGLGAMVAGTVPVPVAAAWTVGLALLAVLATPGRPWLGPVAVLAGVGATFALVRHTVRRFGGVTGDVFGAVVEVGVTICVTVLALG